MKARVLSAAEALDDQDLAARWQSLADESAVPNPMFRPTAIRAAHRHLSGADGIELLVVEDGSDLALLWPFRRGQRLGRAPGRAASTFSHSQFLLATPLVRDADDPGPWAAAFDALSASGAGGCAAFADLDPALIPALARAAGRSGRLVRSLPSQERALARRRTENDYLASQISSSSLKSLERKERGLTRDLGGGLDTVDLLSRDGVDEALSAYIALEAAGWKGQDGGAIGCHPDEERFFYEAAAGLAAEGHLEMYGLEGADGTLAAAALDLVDGPGWFSIKLTFDEDHANRSPGKLLQRTAFARFHDSEREWLDSCSSPNDTSRNRLFPDRRRTATVLVQIGGPAARAQVLIIEGLMRAQSRWRAARRWWRRGGADRMQERWNKAWESVRGRVAPAATGNR